jgi:fructose-bisphosphate aldolase class II
MPIANPEVYREMIKRAKEGGFAYPAINVTSSQTLNATIKGFADAGSDGIVQVSTGGAEFWSGQGVKNMVVGAQAMAAFAHVVADRYDVNIALHTDHCPKDKLPTFMEALVDLSVEQVKAGGDPIFGSNMWDGSAVPLKENIEIAKRLYDKCVQANIILEIEIGVVGGEEDGVVGEINEKLYTTPEDTWQVIEALGVSGDPGTYMVAATFGNVHGVYKPGKVKLRPALLGELQADAAAKLDQGADGKPFNLVFHGGSGSTEAEIHEALTHGTVKMNIDTDTQYAFTRPIVDHMFKNYDGVLKVDGDVGNKKVYDPRSYGKAAENHMSARVVEACEQLKSAGTAMGRAG